MTGPAGSGPDMVRSAGDDGSAAGFEQHRGRLFGLAYRMLGSAADAEDVVQDAFLRWNGADRTAIDSPSAWLTTVVSRLCLNLLAAARVRREQHVGPWLPEPVLTEDGTLGPQERAEQRESVSLAMLTVLERLTPTERAVFVLREAFDYSHRDTAEILELSEAACRQLHSRARRRVQEEGARFAADSAHQRELVERFLVAASTGDLAGLQELLTEDVTSWADGGGRAPTARRPVVGRDRVARYLVGALARFAAGADVAVAEVNGHLAVLGWLRGVLAGVLAPEVAGGQIQALRIVADPEKLRYLDRQSADLSRFAALRGPS